MWTCETRVHERKRDSYSPQSGSVSNFVPLSSVDPEIREAWSCQHIMDTKAICKEILQDGGTHIVHPCFDFFFFSFCFWGGLITTLMAESKTAFTFCNGTMNIESNEGPNQCKQIAVIAH